MVALELNIWTCLIQGWVKQNRLLQRLDGSNPTNFGLLKKESIVFFCFFFERETESFVASIPLIRFLGKV